MSMFKLDIIINDFEEVFKILNNPVIIIDV